MKYETNENEITMLEVVKDKLLFSSLGQIFVVKDFTVKEETERGLFGGKHKVNYITDIKIHTYNNAGKFLGVLRENACEHMLIRYDFYVMRQQWLDFMEQLKAFGFEIVNIAEKK